MTSLLRRKVKDKNLRRLMARFGVEVWGGSSSTSSAFDSSNDNGLGCDCFCSLLGKNLDILGPVVRGGVDGMSVSMLM